MNKVVSQDELDVLLAAGSDASRATAVPYDFRRPDRVTAEQLRSLHLLHERFAHEVATSLSAFLRTTTELAIREVDQLSYGEFLGALPDPTMLYALAMPPVDAVAALEISPGVAFSMVDRLLGGSGGNPSPERPLTEIEQNLVDSVVKLLLEPLTQTWRGLGGAQFAIHGRDTRPQMLQVTGPNEIVVLLTFSIKVADIAGTLRLCIPAAVFEAAGDSVAQAWQLTRRQRTAAEATHLYANLGRVPLAVSAQLSTTLAARELIALAPGDVLSLGHHSGQPVTVSVGEVAAYVGHLVVHQGSLAVRVQGHPADQHDAAAS